MARSDLLLGLVRAGNHGDRALFRRTVEALIAEERSNRHTVLADRLEDALRHNGSASPVGPLRTDDTAQNIFLEITPRRSIQDLILPSSVAEACAELVEEHNRRELLRSHGLEPRHRVLLAGPPGNGKTSLAEALADGLMVPLLVVRYEGVIGSYLGETAVRLKRLFDLVRTHHCVLFFDEFDAIGKERGDVHETGEIKRVVSSLLLQMDALPSHVTVVVATNHPELLDRAVWRRFQLRLHLPPPSKAQIVEWFRRFEQRLGAGLGHSPATMAEKLKGASFSELEDLSSDVMRRWVLAIPDGDMKQIVAERLKQWQERFAVPEPRTE
jgi:SpoVK/Ycf46/Vps4 family AAA+-type ATPase